jgi:hypothetical protein
MKRPTEGNRYEARIRYNPSGDVWNVSIIDTYARPGPGFYKERKTFWSKAQALKFMQEYI